MAEPGPLVEEFFLGEPDLEAYYTSEPYSAMAIQPDMPEATKRARYVEAYGYDLKPPLDGERECYVVASFDELDEISLAATRRGLPRCVTEEEVEQVRDAYAESDLGDAWWVAWRCRQHVHLVIAILDYLHSLGQLPSKPWGA